MEISMDPEAAWDIIEKVFPIITDKYPTVLPDRITFTPEQFSEACMCIKENDIQEVIQKLVINCIEGQFRCVIVPEFWAYFHSNNHDGMHLFHDAVKSLYNHYKDLDITIQNLHFLREKTQLEVIPYTEDTIEDLVKVILKASVQAQLHLDYQTVTTKFYENALKLEDPDEVDYDKECVVCMQDFMDCNCLFLFRETNKMLGEMNLLEPMVGQTLTNVSYEHIHGHIKKVCKDNYDSFIKALEQWLQSAVISWLKKIYCYDTSIQLEESMKIFEKKLENYLYNSYTKERIDQLFNIVIEYPESLPALEDIKLCLPRSDLKATLTKTLQKAMETRLLHPGVSTTDILTAYVATIKSLRVLDPTGLLLETTTYPIHQYLRTREDTVRCIVSSLTEDGSNELAEELTRGEAADENAPVDEEDDDWENWTPDPIDCLPHKKLPKDTGINRRNADIITMLVNIYGSNELFVNEYRTMLADRLLSQYTCDTEKEIRYLELLKIRFGDSHLHFCEVMLKDIADSKRINQRIKEDADYDESTPLGAMIVSQHFWPPFKDEKLELHEGIVEQMKKFTAGFEMLKGSRTLCWKNHLGSVNIDIELNDRTLNLSVSPVHATILMHFQDKSTWELDELSKKMQCPSTILRRKIGFWLSHGILTEVKTDVFSVQEEVENKNASQEFFVEEFEAESAMASVQDQKEEELQNIWSYILGMLMNLDSLSLDRIHHMLKMFAFQGPTTECSQSELKLFLDRKVRERQLIFANGLYKLPK